MTSHGPGKLEWGVTDAIIVSHLSVHTSSRGKAPAVKPPANHRHLSRRRPLSRVFCTAHMLRMSLACARLNITGLDVPGRSPTALDSLALVLTAPRPATGPSLNPGTSQLFFHALPPSVRRQMPKLCCSINNSLVLYLRRFSLFASLEALISEWKEGTLARCKYLLMLLETPDRGVGPSPRPECSLECHA